jgi:hypothetical protein
MSAARNPRSHQGGFWCIFMCVKDRKTHATEPFSISKAGGNMWWISSAENPGKHKDIDGVM